MALFLTPDILRAAYDFLCETEPFAGWNMPDPDTVRFVAHKDKSRQGRCTHYSREGDGKYGIDISETFHHHTCSLMATLAHEMIHLHMFHQNLKERTSHGKLFKAFAAEVCAAHGFDQGQF